MAEVRLESVTKSFGSFKALDNISISFKEGGFYALLGPSGSGKTTILRLIAGFEQADKGKLFIGNAEMEGIPVEKREIGMVFQNYALFPNMTVKGNIDFGLRVKKINKEIIENKVRESLELVQLKGLDDRKPDQLSGGQRQRVALARALVTSPNVLLLDEPFSALDKALRLDMQIELKRIQREVGITTIFVTHDQEEAITLSDSIGILDQGILRQEGSPTEVYQKPESEFIATFLGDSNILSVKKDGKDFSLADGSRLNINPEVPNIGDQFKVSIRSEKIFILQERNTDNGGFDNIHEVKIEQSFFAGRSLTYLTSLGGSRIKVFQQNVGTTIHPEGSLVKIAWKSSDMIFLKP